MFQSTFVKAVSPSVDQMEDGIYVRLAARPAVVIQAGADPVGRAPVQRVARRPTNCYRQLEAGEGHQPVGRAPVHRQPPRPSIANRELKEKVQQAEEAPRQEEIEDVDSSSSADESDPQLFLENRVRKLLRRVCGNASEELQDALDSEERKARRVRQEEIDSEVLAEREEQKRRRQRGEPTRSLKRASLHFDNVLLLSVFARSFLTKKPTTEMRSWVSCCLTLSWVGNPVRRYFAHAALVKK